MGRLSSEILALKAFLVARWLRREFPGSRVAPDQLRRALETGASMEAVFQKHAAETRRTSGRAFGRVVTAIWRLLRALRLVRD